jgi:NAD(P)-dependent dehydrogenase (short-subunit alcohol dehydrogenase family)
VLVALTGAGHEVVAVVRNARAAERVAARGATALEGDLTDAAWFAQALDISPSGCGVFRPDGCVLLEDEIVRLFFYPDGETAAAIVPARVARVSDTLIGIEYHEPQRVPPVHRH